MKTTILGIGSLFFWITLALANDFPPRMTVVVTPNPVEETQSVQLRIEINAPLSTVVFQPTFDAIDFVQIGSQPSYGGMAFRQIINGKESSSKRTYFEYVLSPKKRGMLAIRNIKVKVGDKEITSPDMNVKVTADTSPAIPEEEEANPAPTMAPSTMSALDEAAGPKRFNSDFTVWANVSKTKAYVGEPIVVEYWLYDFGALRQMEVQKWPSFNNFWKDDLEITTRFDFNEIYEQNRQMRRAFLGRFALFGIKPGKFELDRLIVRGQYISGTSNQGFFQTQQYRTSTHGSQDVKLEILPLPTEGKPSRFSGAVGKFKLKLQADKTTVVQHSPLIFTLTVEGEGNFQAIDAIPLSLPKDFEIYEKKTLARAPAPLGESRNLESKRSFQVTIIPRREGKFVVEPTKWNFFNPEREAYQTIETEALEIEVSPGKDTGVAQNSYLTSSSTPPPLTTEERILPLKKIPEEMPRTWWKTVFSVLALLNLYLGFLFLRARRDSYAEIFQNDYRDLENQLEEVRNSSNWIAALEEAILQIFTVCLRTNARGLTRSDLELEWKEAAHPPQAFFTLAKVLDEIDRMRFSSGSSAPSKDKAGALIQDCLLVVKDLKIRARYKDKSWKSLFVFSKRG